jgi:predicted DNA-binding transcriptional regulator YafY
MNDNGTREAASALGWTFLSNHGHVLLCIAREPEIRLRDVAERVGITERAVQRIVVDLEDAGFLSHVKEGRRNRYEIHADRRLRHPVVAHQEVSVLLDLLGSGRPHEPEVSTHSPASVSLPT